MSSELLFDFLSKEHTVKPDIVGRGIIPVGSKCIIGGGAKTNKSFVTLSMALSIAKGKPLFDAYYKNGTPVFPVSKSWKVLLMEQEIGSQGLRNRLLGILGGDLESAICPLFIRSKDMNLKLDSSEGLNAIEREVDEVRPDLLILDPLSKFHSSNENDAQEMGKVLGAGDYLMQKYNTALMIVHHTGLAALDKESGRRGGAKLRGSSAIFADVDTFIELQRLGSPSIPEPVLSLSFELRQAEPISTQHVKRLKSGQISYIGEQQNLLNAAGGI